MKFLRHTGRATWIWAAMVLPALLLGFLSLRSAEEQRIILERKEAALRQQQTDQMASQIRLAVSALFEQFSSGLEQQLARVGAGELAPQFPERLPQWWKYPGLGFAVTLDGAILSPQLDSNQPNREASRFLADHGGFFANTQEANVYQSIPTTQAELQKLQQAAPPAAENKDSSYAQSKSFLARTQQNLMNSSRSVMPQKKGSDENASEDNISTVASSFSRFGELVSGKDEGILSRFVDDRLEILFWKRPRGAPGTVFGIRFRPENLRGIIQTAAQVKTDDAVRLAVLDEHGTPLTLSHNGFKTNWKNPFVSTEIGEILPRWEAALYLADPAQLNRVARSARLASWTVVFLACASMGLGMFFLAQRTRQQLELARRKTDFVSNVSHELKTPLTSIRMFAELLEEGRVTDRAKTAHYLSIIRQESERLTRLINNVLDFAKIDRGEKNYRRHAFDFNTLLEQVWESHRPHLEQEGFVTAWETDGQACPVHGDQDALAQILVNLLSNAEKYSTEGCPREIHLKSFRNGRDLVVEVGDRGVGIPPGQETKIFERFHRAHDALSSGIAGTGLGLTLALRIAQDHGGNLACRPRSGGGTIFTLTLPLSNEPLPPPYPT